MKTIFLQKEPIFDCLYPYSGEERPLSEGIQRFKAVVLLAKDAVAMLLQKKCIYFDPLVGDNACQLRTDLFIDLINEPSYQKDLQDTLRAIEQTKLALESHQVLQAQKSMTELIQEKKTTQKKTLRTYLSENSLNIEIAKITKIITYSYLLTITKKSDTVFEKDSANFQIKASIKETAENITKVRPDLEMTEKSGAKWETIARKELSHFSVALIQEEAKRISSSTKEILVHRLSSPFIKTDQRHMQHAPLLPGMQVLMELALQDEIPIQLKIQRIEHETGNAIDRVELLFYPNATKTHYEWIPSNHLPPKAGYLIEAVSIRPREETLSTEEFIKDLKQIDLIQSIFAFCASHPPYGGSLRDSDNPHADEETARYKQFALEEGFCQANPKRYQLLHIHVEMLG